MPPKRSTEKGGRAYDEKMGVFGAGAIGRTIGALMLNREKQLPGHITGALNSGVTKRRTPSTGRSSKLVLTSNK